MVMFVNNALIDMWMLVLNFGSKTLPLNFFSGAKKTAIIAYKQDVRVSFQILIQMPVIIFHLYLCFTL